MTTALPHYGPLRFRLDGSSYELPEVSTRVWLDALQQTTRDNMAHRLLPAWWSIIPQQLPALQARSIAVRVQDPDDVLDLDQLEKHALRLLALPLGMDLHVAQRLVMEVVLPDWRLFDARCASYGLDPLDMSISRVLSVAYSIRLERCQKDSEVTAARMKLFAPPEGTRASGASWDDDPEMHAHLDRIESDAFLALF